MRFHHVLTRSAPVSFGAHHALAGFSLDATVHMACLRQPCQYQVITCCVPRVPSHLVWALLHCGASTVQTPCMCITCRQSCSCTGHSSSTQRRWRKHGVVSLCMLWAQHARTHTTHIGTSCKGLLVDPQSPYCLVCDLYGVGLFVVAGPCVRPWAACDETEWHRQLHRTAWCLCC
jgi:hypothetical protein